MNTIITPTGSYNSVFMIKLELQMGTSVSKIESTYGHIMVLEQADQIIKKQEISKRSGINLDTPEVQENEKTSKSIFLIY